jgi:hypothetical protein
MASTLVSTCRRRSKSWRSSGPSAARGEAGRGGGGAAAPVCVEAASASCAGRTGKVNFAGLTANIRKLTRQVD